ncbi:unnamed protein product [Ascophyllum nodosum]
MACLCKALVWMVVFHLVLTEYNAGIGKARLPEWLNWRRSLWGSTLARKYSGLLGGDWGVNAEASTGTFWQRWGSEWQRQRGWSRRLGTNLEESPLPTEMEVEDALRPLESRCFTYLPSSWSGLGAGLNETFPEPFTFQWCYQGRATIHMQNGRNRQQLDLGTSEETTMSFQPADASERKAFLPAVVQRFSGGGSCDRTAARRNESSGKTPGERFDAHDGQDTVGLTVQLWCCGPTGKERKEEGGAEIVNFVDDSDSDSGCSDFIGSVCTNLLCPLFVSCDSSYSTFREFLDVDRTIDVESGSYRKPPPPTVVSRRQRGFVEYDRRKVMEPEERLQLKEEIREMFHHGYDGYMKHAFPGGELLPLSCQSGELHLVKLPLVTLVDSLDALAIMGNASEFRRAVRLVSEGLDVTADVDVSVFETNIRLLGGLLSAHLLASDPKLDLYPCPRRDDASFSVNYDGVGVDEGTGERDLEGEGHDERDKGRCFGHGCTDFDAGVDVVDAHDAGADGVGDAVFGGGGSVDRGRGERDDDDDGDDKCEDYKGQLLALAEELGRRLLPAFETPTGIPYGTVNLESGVPDGETPISSLAGAGSLTIEFSVLSALTGDGVFAEVAEGAVKALFDRRSVGLGLVGKHINTTSGAWTEAESGIGTNGDSFYEYLIKMYILWGDVYYWDMFMQAYSSIQRFVREGDWYATVEINTGFIFSRTFDNLMAFWPGIQVLLGDVSLASRTLNSMFLIWRDWGFLPEQFDHHRWELKGEGVGRAYPLRPELIESTLHVYQATGDVSWLWAGKDFLGSLKAFCRTECGFASVRDVGDCTLDEQMPSFFLSETLKYLYLLFDEDNFLHKGNYVFSTEAHPFSIDAVRRGGRFRAERGVEEAGRVRGSSSSNGEDGGGGNATLHSNNPPPFTHVDVTPAIRNPETHASHGDDDGEEGGDGSRGGYGEAVPLSAEAGEMGRRGSGAWAALRASGGEGYRLGPEGWRDTNILFWVQVGGAGGLDKRPDTHVVVRGELRYMRTLWQMYTERICPVLPWWMAPYRYSPSDFKDSLTTGGRMAWLTLGGVDSGQTGSDLEEGDFLEEVLLNESSQYLTLEGVGIIAVSVQGNDFTVFHPATGETLVITQAFGPRAGMGLPGSSDGGAMHVSGFTQARPKTRVVSTPANESHERRAMTTAAGEVDVDGGQDSVGSGDGAAEGTVGLGDGGGEEKEAEGSEGSTPATPREGRGNPVELGGEDEARATRQERLSSRASIGMALERVSPLHNLVVTKEVGLARDDSVFSLCRCVECCAHVIGDSNVQYKSNRKRSTIAAVSAMTMLIVTCRAVAWRSRVSVRALPLAQHQTQGLTVYCAVSLLKTYSCSVATFSPPGVGLVILPPIDAPLQLVETFYPGSCGDVSGCSPPHEETLAAAEPNADILLGEKSVRSSQGQYGREGIPGGGGALSPAMGVSEGAEAVPIGGDATGATEGGKGGGGVYAGKILVVARGDCTFEQKARLAEDGGALGLVVINNEPGGHVFAMQGGTENDEGTFMSVTIPAVMVGMEDGLELRRALMAMNAAEGDPVEGVLDIRTHHQSKRPRLTREQHEGLRDNRGVLIAAERGQSFGDKSSDRGKADGDDLEQGPELEPDSPGGSSSPAGGREGRPRPETSSPMLASVEEGDQGLPGTMAASSSMATGHEGDAGAGDSETCGLNNFEAGDDAEGDTDVVGGEGSGPDPGPQGGSWASGDEEFPFLMSGFDEVTLGGMRPPLFLLPTVIVGDNYVQVLGRGHWGVLVFPHDQGRWALSLMHNVFNPPPASRRKRSRDAAAATAAPSAATNDDDDDDDDGDCDAAANDDDDDDDCDAAANDDDDDAAAANDDYDDGDEDENPDA